VIPDSASAEPQAILYYFHRTSRCETCLAIEAALETAIRTRFASALRANRLQWLPTNIERPENEHFREEFSLEFSAAVLVRLHDGESVGWTNLEDVWDLFEDPEAFNAYIEEHLRAVLEPGMVGAEDRKGDADQNPRGPGS
jgi:hypothetical protein